MDDLDIKDVLQIINRRKFVLIAAVGLSLILAMAYAFNMDPIYRASAKILIDQKAPKAISIKDVLVYDSKQKEFLNTQYALLKSRSLVKSVILKLHLEKSEEFKRKPPLMDLTPLKQWTNSLLEQAGIKKKKKGLKVETNPYTPLIDSFLERLKIVPMKDSKIVTIRFFGFSPFWVAKITNTLTELYISQSLEFRSQIETGAGDWLKIKIEELKGKIKNSELKLQKFITQRNFIDSGEKRDFSVQKLTELIKEESRAKTERLRLQTLIHELKEFSDDPFQMFQITPESIKSDAIRELYRNYNDLKGQLNVLSKNKGPRHPDIISLSQKVKTLENRIPKEMDRLVKSLELDYKSAAAREKDIKSSVEKQRKRIINLDKDAVQYESLKQEVETNKKLFDMLLNRVKELDISSNYNETNIRVVDRAEVPILPFKPKKALNMVLALCIGMAGGLLLIFFLESIDKNLKTEGDVDRQLPYPLLGSLGLFPKKESPLPVTTNNSVFGEEFRSLRTHLLSSISTNPHKTILITSVLPEEGKATVVSNLAIALGQIGKKVVLIDADLKNSKGHKIFGTDISPGLVDGLTDSEQLKGIFQKTQYPGLWLVPAGRADPSSSFSVDLLFSQVLQSFIKGLKNMFDVILIKAPPVLSGSDASIIEKSCDSILLVVQSGASNKTMIQRAIGQLLSSPPQTKSQGLFRRKEDKIKNLSRDADSKSKFLGIVLNKVKNKNKEYYGHQRKRYKRAGDRDSGNNIDSTSKFKNWRAAGYLAAAAIVILSLIPSFPLQTGLASIPLGDYFAHLSSYAILMFCFSKAFTGKSTQFKLGMGFLTMGILLEILQIPVEGRGFELTDIMGEMLGIIIGFTVTQARGKGSPGFASIDQILRTKNN
ncbi:MAG: polysaccharide biosynthesis tyrosine autokinase [Nitrospinaceae bacterium]